MEYKYVGRKHRFCLIILYKIISTGKTFKFEKQAYVSVSDSATKKRLSKSVLYTIPVSYEVFSTIGGSLTNEERNG